MAAPTAMARASITPLPSPTVAPSASPAPALFSRAPHTPHPKAAPSASLAPSPSSPARPTHKPTATPAPGAQTPKPKLHPSPSPTAIPYVTPAPLHHVPTSSPSPPAVALTGGDQAAGVVRSYLGALARGDRAAATAYLAHGTPSENFMDTSAHIESIRSASNGGQQYTVTADVQTSSGEYYITFTVAPGPGGMQITDHYSIKPQ
jgi:hypothetical protein